MRPLSVVVHTEFLGFISYAVKIHKLIQWQVLISDLLMKGIAIQEIRAYEAV